MIFFNGFVVVVGEYVFVGAKSTYIFLDYFFSSSELTPDANIRWSIPVETNKADEKYLALPLYGDIKFTSRSVNKTIKISLEHIDFVSDGLISMEIFKTFLITRCIFLTPAHTEKGIQRQSGPY